MWDLDREAVGVLGAWAGIAAFGCLASGRVLRLRRQGDVVVNELAPGDQHNGHRVVMESLKQFIASFNFHSFDS